MNKKVIFLLNYVSESDAQHYVHAFNFIDKIEKEFGWSIKVFSERGGGYVNSIFGREIIFLSKQSKIIRYLALIFWMIIYRVNGYKLIYIRISKVSTIIATIVGSVIGVKVLYWQSGTVHDWDNKALNINKILNWLFEVIALRLLDGFITGPESMRNYYIKLYPILNNKIHLLYNDIDLSRFSRKKNINNNNNNLQKITFLIVHRYSPVRETIKYFPSILISLTYLLDHFSCVQLIMVGDGPETLLLKRLSEENNKIDIQFMGAIPNKGIENIYNKADIFLMPSYREGFPRVILEAMAMGLPIIATDAGGTKEIVGPKQQTYIIDKDDPITFGKKIIELSFNNHVRSDLSNENLETVKRFASEEIASMFNKIFTNYI